MLEDHLSSRHKGEWLAGPDFTAADIMLSYTLELLKFASQAPAEVPAVLTAERYPQAAAYWGRLQVCRHRVDVSNWRFASELVPRVEEGS